MNLATAMTRMQMKKTSRQKALEARSKIAASRDGAAAALRLKNNFLSAFDVQAYQSVAAYWPFRDEIDVRPLFAALEDFHFFTCLFFNRIMGLVGKLQEQNWISSFFAVAMGNHSQKSLHSKNVEAKTVIGCDFCLYFMYSNSVGTLASHPSNDDRQRTFRMETSQYYISSKMWK